MGGEWRSGTVLELQAAGVLLVEDGNHGEYRPRPDEFVDRGVAFIRAADMDNGRVLFDAASKINEVARRRITKGVGARGDVLLSHKGTVGKVALVPDDAPDFVCSPQTTFWRVLDEDVLDRRYLHALLRSPGFHRQLATRAGETDMAPYVSLTSQRGLTVSFPPLPEQRAIARILSALDDKIELNRKMNATLEAMARALFKSWFVDFGPVRAKAEGQTPNDMDPATAALFPSEFQDSELGEIPKGWAICPLGDVLELKRGYDLPTKQRVPGAVPIVSSSGPSGWHAESKVEGPGVATGRYGTIGRVFLVWEDFWPLNTTLYLRDRKGNDLLYCYFLLRGIDFFKFSDKAAVPGVNRNHVHQEAVVCPPLAIQRAFSQLVVQWLGLVRVNESQGIALAEIRDAFLPRLLSGELSVTQADQAMEATA